MSLKILALAAGLMIAGTALAQSNQLEITNAWARATPGEAKDAAAYVTIRSQTGDKLVSASSPIAKKTELHTMSMTGMVMKMRPIDAVDLPAGEAVTLAPGGMHLMLLGLSQPLRAGQSFPITLNFEKAGTRSVNVAIEKVGAAGPGHASH